MGVQGVADSDWWTDTTIPRKRVERDPLVQYWHDHQPTKPELARAFGLSVRRIDQLFAEGWLQKGECWYALLHQFIMYQQKCAAEGRGGMRMHRG